MGPFLLIAQAYGGNVNWYLSKLLKSEWRFIVRIQRSVVSRYNPSAVNNVICVSSVMAPRPSGNMVDMLGIGLTDDAPG